MDKKTSLLLGDAALNTVVFLFLAFVSWVMLLLAGIWSELVWLLFALVYSALMSKMERKAETKCGISFLRYILLCVLTAYIPCAIAAAAYLVHFAKNPLTYYNDLYAVIIFASAPIVITAGFVVINRVMKKG